MDFKTMTIDELTQWCTQQYSEISIKEKKLDDGKKALFAKMAESDTTEVKSPFGRFYRKVVTSWKMPNDIIEAKNFLAEQEELAKAEGRAEKVEKFTYAYGAVKKEDAI